MPPASSSAIVALVSFLRIAGAEQSHGPAGSAGTGGRCGTCTEPDAESLDWKGVVEAAHWHGVSGLLAERLSTASRLEQLPEETRRALALDRRGASFRAMAQLAALGQIAPAMEGAGLPILAWKGIALAQTLYGSYGARASSDLDLLIRGVDVERAVHILQTLGFAAATGCATEAAARRASHLNCERQLVRSRDQVRLELHDEVMPRLFGRSLEMEHCFARAEWMELAGQISVRTLAPSDLLISLSVHGAKHGWERLKWVCDIAAFLQRFSDQGVGTTGKTAFAWPQVLVEARRVGALEPVLCGLRLAARLLGAREPAAVASCDWHRAAIGKVVEARANWLLRGMLEERTVRESMAHALEALSTRRSRAAYLVRRCVTANELDVEAFGLAPGLSALYTPLRMVRLLRKQLAAGLGRASLR